MALLGEKQQGHHISRFCPYRSTSTLSSGHRAVRCLQATRRLHMQQSRRWLHQLLTGAQNTVFSSSFLQS
jgi:truncated hemoglobin YjbI